MEDGTPGCSRVRLDAAGCSRIRLDAGMPEMVPLAQWDYVLVSQECEKQHQKKLVNTNSNSQKKLVPINNTYSRVLGKKPK